MTQINEGLRVPDLQTNYLPENIADPLQLLSILRQYATTINAINRQLVTQWPLYGGMGISVPQTNTIGTTAVKIVNYNAQSPSFQTTLDLVNGTITAEADTTVNLSATVAAAVDSGESYFLDLYRNDAFFLTIATSSTSNQNNEVQLNANILLTDNTNDYLDLRVRAGSGGSTFNIGFASFLIFSVGVIQ